MIDTDPTGSAISWTSRAVRAFRSLLDREIIRFGLIGLVNTAFGYGLFVVLQLTLGRVIQYTIVQAISNLIAIVQAYWLQRWLVFRHKGNWWAALVKFASVYAGAFFFSLAFVALLVEVFKVNVLVAGAITVVVQALGTYGANKWFTFRQPKKDATADGSSDTVATTATTPDSSSSPGSA